ncbi:MAG: ribonuclease P protein component [Bacteroidota bacterium]
MAEETRRDRPQRNRPRRNGWPRAFRLKRRRLIRPLFDRSRTDVRRVTAGSIAVLYRLASEADVGRRVPIQVGFAPGRRARTNAGRTRLRRLLRETFRVHQHPLVDLFSDRPETLTAMVLFRGQEATASQQIRRDLPRALDRVLNELQTEQTRSQPKAAE